MSVHGNNCSNVSRYRYLTWQSEVLIESDLDQTLLKECVETRSKYTLVVYNTLQKRFSFQKNVCIFSLMFLTVHDQARKYCKHLRAERMHCPQCAAGLVKGTRRFQLTNAHILHEPRSNTRSRKIELLHFL